MIHMPSSSSRLLGTFILAAAITLLPMRASAGVAVSVTVPVKYGEKYSGRYTFPDNTHWLYQAKGSTKINLELPLNTVDISQFGDTTYINLNITYFIAAVEYSYETSIFFSADPKYEPGDLSARTTHVVDFLGKPFKASIAKLKINPKKQVLRVQLRLATAEQTLDGVGADPGQAILAPQFVEPGPVSQIINVTAKLYNNGVILLTGNSHGLVGAGKVITQPLDAPIPGTYSNRKFSAKGFSTVGP
jgi:hypothetical protein